MLYFEIYQNADPKSPAFTHNGKVTTYAEFAHRVDVWAAYLQELGLTRGERVGLVSKNCTEFAIAYIAVIKAGGVIVPVNFQLAAPEIAYIAHDSAMRFIITQNSLSKLPEALDALGNEPVRQLRWEDLDNGDASALSVPKMNEDMVCDIIYTSGTTGRPKGAMLTHRNLISNAQNFMQSVDTRKGDTLLCVLPMYHAFGWTTVVTLGLLLNGFIVISEDYTLEKAVGLIEKYKIQGFYGVPTMFQMFYDGANPKRLATLRYYISGGASLPHKLARDFAARFGKPVQEGYGLSECSPVVTVNLPDKVKPGSIGPVIANTSCIIASEDDKELPRGTVGQLLVQSPSVMRGYLNQPTASAETLRNGWLHTGDLAYMDDEGWIFIVDRLKDMIITAGENVYPRELEEILYQHPAIREVAVVGVPDKLRGQAIAAYISLRPGAEITKPELRKFIRGKVANYKLPKYFVFMDQLPKNNTGKILKRVLQERGVEDMVTRIG